MSGLTDRLRQVAGQARDQRDGMDDVSLDHYRMPPSGAFVGEHTGFMVVHPLLVEAMLDVIDAVSEISFAYDGAQGPYLQGVRADEMQEVIDALSRFREVSS